MPKEILPELGHYLQLLMRWNSVMNLVGARSWQDCLQNLIIDSLYLNDFLVNLPLNDDFNCWDLGAGAGLPGIPLRMLWHKGSYTLVEIREKRALFLSNVLAQISLANTHVFRGAAEDFFAKSDYKADIIISRAFMPWQEILNFVREHIKNEEEQGRIIFLTLSQADTNSLQQLGYKLEKETHYTVSKSTRWIWSIQKNT